MATRQVDLHVVTAPLVQALNDGIGLDRLGIRSARTALEILSRTGDNELDLRKDTEVILEQMSSRKPKLPALQQPRVDAAVNLEKELGVLANLEMSSRKLKVAGYPDTRFKAYQQGVELQFVTAGDFLQIARLLRGKTDRLEALKEAREKLTKVIDGQKVVR